MSKYLVVIESPGKLAAYRKYLGPEYDICASMGHVMDLPQKGSIGVDIKNDFAPTLEVIPGKSEVLGSINAKAKKASKVYLMTDPDREGSGIAWMIASQLPKGVDYCRATTSSITKDAIRKAIENAGEIDERMVESFWARRILDRICGWKTSFLVKQATGGKSAGRVQSAALRILAEREKEIISFKPEEYWPVDAELLTKSKKKVVAHVVLPEKMEIKTEAHAKEVESEIRDYVLKVASYDTKESSRSPFPPFTTSMLQATASSMFGWDQKRTMGVAQKLYEQGHITYMRTDSSYVVPEKVSEIRGTITHRYGVNYMPAKAVFYRAGKNAQEAHEAIRPTNLDASAVGAGDEGRLYQLIWKRTISSQMLPERRETVRATFGNGRQKVVLAASGSRQLFDGWRKCWDYSEAGDTFLPEMEVGEVVDVLGVNYEQKFTEPPPRYGIASFNAKLEDRGIGRPSTLATVVETLKARGYIESDKKSHKVTDLGLRVVDFLVAADFCFADVNFTREMEDKLDDILERKTEKLSVLTDFWKRLSDDLSRAKARKDTDNLSPYPCPQCRTEGREKFLVKKFSQFGPFYSCEARTDKDIKCDYTAKVGESDEPVEKVKKPKAEPSGFKCPNCGKDLVKRSSAYGPFLGCSGYPSCKTTADLEGNVKQKSAGGKKKFWRKKR
jgi:DNA topoisomerase-1